MLKDIKVGIGDMKIARREGTLITYALGSCIGITFYDPGIKLGAMVHILLPEAGANSAGNVFKFADTGIRETLRKMEVFGGVKSRYQCKVAGGARMFEMTGGVGNIGERNIKMVEQVLAEERVRIMKKDVGANYARTMLLNLETGEVRVRTSTRQEIIL
ncbi:MAG: chemotaxis protein CheD [Firmicutes bacterium]|nr:chemotaxis protein CheD [Bacillota bacterium]